MRIRQMVAFAAAVVWSLSAQAQLTPGRILQNKYVVNGYNHSYETPVVEDTPAPEGFVPFYITHVGRHGSRYDLGEGANFVLVTESLQKAADILTPEGEEVLREVTLMKEASEGMYEMLSQRGCREHRGISARMMKRFPEVFSSSERTQVDAVSSVVQRCIVSMTNFLLEIGREHPSMEISMDTGDRYMRYLMHWDSMGRRQQTTVRPDGEQFLRDSLDVSRLYSALFTDTEKASGICDPYRFAKALFFCTTFTETMDMEDKVDLYRHFTLQELYILGANLSDRFYTENGNSLLYGTTTALQGKRLLRDFLEKADAALAPGSRRAADLRFSHDTAILPFCTLLGFSGMDIKVSQTEAHRYVCMADQMPMGSNFQMVFYRSPSDSRTLVKILYNEKERLMPASLKPVQGPYYDWENLRSYLDAISR